MLTSYTELTDSRGKTQPGKLNDEVNYNRKVQLSTKGYMSASLLVRNMTTPDEAS